MSASPNPTQPVPPATLLGTIERRITAVALCAALGVGVIAFRSWLDARDDRMRMSATLVSQGTIIAAAEKREQDRAEQLADTLKQIADLKRSVQTPQQVLREIPQFLPPLPQPLETLLAKTPPPTAAHTVNGRPDTPQKPGEVAAGTTQPDVRVPSADLKPLFDFVQDCRACQAKLSSAQQDLQDERAKGAALTKERDTAVKAAKGGGVWTRTLRAIKWIGVGFVVGYVAKTATR